MRLIFVFLTVMVGMVCAPVALAQERDEIPAAGEPIVIGQDLPLAATRDVFELELKNLAARSSLEVLGVEIDRKVKSGAGKKGDLSVQSTSCTASATVGVPGVGEVTISATASTCEEAVAQVIAGVKEVLKLAE